MKFDKPLKPIIICGVLVSLLFAPLYLSGYSLHLLTFMIFNSVLAISLRFIMLTGSIFLGHTAFMGIGGYTTALLVVKMNTSCELALLSSAVLSILVAILLGVMVLRLRGVYFIIVSIAFIEIIRLFVTWWEPVTGGTAGIYVPKPVIFGFRFTAPSHLYGFAAVLGLLSFFVLYRLENSRLGMTLKSIAQAEDLAEAIGVNTTYYKVTGFAIGSLIAGLCGAFFAFYMQFIAPQYVSFLTAVYILIYCIVGGTWNIWGPIVGASILTLLSEPIRGMAHYEVLAYGIILMAIAILLPEGLISIPSTIKRLLAKELS